MIEPTEPGFYWLRYEGDDSPAIARLRVGEYGSPGRREWEFVGDCCSGTWVDVAPHLVAIEKVAPPSWERKAVLVEPVSGRPYTYDGPTGPPLGVHGSYREPRQAPVDPKGPQG